MTRSTRKEQRIKKGGLKGRRRRETEGVMCISTVHWSFWREETDKKGRVTHTDRESGKKRIFGKSVAPVCQSVE